MTIKVLKKHRMLLEYCKAPNIIEPRVETHFNHQLITLGNAHKNNLGLILFFKDLQYAKKMIHVLQICYYINIS